MRFTESWQEHGCEDYGPQQVSSEDSRVVPQRPIFFTQQGSEAEVGDEGECDSPRNNDDKCDWRGGYIRDRVAIYRE